MLLKKGFIFSLDSLIALLATIVLIGASFFYLSQVQTLNWSQPSLYTTSLDTMQVLRIDGSLEWSIDNLDSSNISLFMDVMYPSNICGNMIFYNRTRDVQLDAFKSGCDNLPDDSKDIFVTRRTFVHNKSIYFAFLRVWYS